MLKKFEEDFQKSLEIEKLFRKHPKFPFVKLEDDVAENVLLHLFWKYMVTPYLRQYPDEWIDYSSNYYQTFRIYENTYSLMLNFYGKQSKHFLTVCPIDKYEDKFGDDHFGVNTGIDDFLAEVSGNKQDELYFLGLGVDLRHQKALDAAREFMYAFFVEKLPLDEMEQKIARFEKEEGWKFKRRK